VLPHDHPPPGIRWDGTAGVHKAQVPALHNAVRHDMLEESAEKLEDIALGGARSGPAGFAGGESAGAVFARDEAAVGEGDRADRGGKVLAGGMAVWMGLAVDMPVGMPDPGVEALHKTGVGPLVFEDRPGEGREGCDGDKEGGARREPLGAVLGAPPARDNGVEVGMGLELPAPGVQAPRKTREVGAKETLGLGEACDGWSGRCAQGRRGELLRRAEKGA
jgi:hypothetical protein